METSSNLTTSSAIIKEIENFTVKGEVTLVSVQTPLQRAKKERTAKMKEAINSPFSVIRFNRSYAKETFEVIRQKMKSLKSGTKLREFRANLEMQFAKDLLLAGQKSDAFLNARNLLFERLDLVDLLRVGNVWSSGLMTSAIDKQIGISNKRTIESLNKTVNRVKLRTDENGDEIKGSEYYPIQDRIIELLSTNEISTLHKQRIVNQLCKIGNTSFLTDSKGTYPKYLKATVNAENETNIEVLEFEATAELV